MQTNPVSQSVSTTRSGSIEDAPGPPVETHPQATNVRLRGGGTTIEAVVQQPQPESRLNDVLWDTVPPILGCGVLAPAEDCYFDSRDPLLGLSRPVRTAVSAAGAAVTTAGLFGAVGLAIGLSAPLAIAVVGSSAFGAACGSGAAAWLDQDHPPKTKDD